MSNERQKEQERRSRKLFIGGVSFSTNDEDFFKYFAKYGELEDCVLIREKDTGQSRGFGFVTYKDKAVSDHVATQQLYLDGRRLDPKPSISRYNMDQIHEHRNQTTKVFVGGLHDDTAEAEMSEHFGRFGEVLEVNIMYDRFTNAPRGFGFVTFKDPDVAQTVINYEQDHIVHGKKVDCKPATARKDAFKKFPDAPSTRVEKPTSREERWRKYHGHEDRQSGHTQPHSSHDPYSRSHHYPSYPRNDIPHHHSSYGHRHPSSYPPPPQHSGYPSTHHHSTHQPQSSSSSSSSYPPHTTSSGIVSGATSTSYAHHNTPSYHYPAPNDPSRAKDVTTATSTLPPYEYSRYDPYASYRQDPRYSAHYPPPPTQPPATTTPAATTRPATATPSTAANSTATTSNVTAPQTAANTGNTQVTATQPTATPPTTAPMYDYSQYQYPSYYPDQTHPTSSASATASATSASAAAASTSTSAATATAPRYDYYSQYGRVAPPRPTSTTKPSQSQAKTTTMPSGYGASRGSVATNSAQANRYSAY